jgi:hypothetical protein
MLHAKVALLGFAEDAEAPISNIRLVVSTGNWTPASIDRQIEMLWIAGTDFNRTPPPTSASEIVEACRFFNNLMSAETHHGPLFQPLPSVPRLDELQRKASELPKKRKSRFIHSIAQPLLPQIVGCLPRPEKKWNFLYLGSGFYEQDTDGGKKPIIINRIEKSLSSRLQQNASKSVLVNLHQAGAIASWRQGQEWERGWELLKPQNDRILHAKFIAAGRKAYGQYRDVAVYLGSGNLSKAGLLTSLATDGQSERFVCSVRASNRHCGQRVAVLYGDGELFACRNCYQLAYESQQEGPFLRSIRRSQKIRMRLGGSLDPFGPIPEKPRGMWRRTYDRHCATLARVEHRVDFLAR